MLLGIGQRLLCEQSQTDATGTTAQAFRHSGVEDTIHSIEWSDGASTGTVEIEAADSETYAGSWFPIATVTFDATAPRVQQVRVSGGYGAFRHRISSPVNDGGTVTSKVRGYV